MVRGASSCYILLKNPNKCLRSSFLISVLLRGQGLQYLSDCYRRPEGYLRWPLQMMNYT